MPDKCDNHQERLIKLELLSERMEQHVSQLKQTAYSNRERLISLCGEDGKNGAVGVLRQKMAKIEETADKLESWLAKVENGRAGDRVKITLLLSAATMVASAIGAGFLAQVF